MEKGKVDEMEKEECQNERQREKKKKKKGQEAEEEEDERRRKKKSQLASPPVDCCFVSLFLTHASFNGALTPMRPIVVVDGLLIRWLSWMG